MLMHQEDHGMRLRVLSDVKERLSVQIVKLLLLVLSEVTVVDEVVLAGHQVRTCWDVRAEKKRIAHISFQNKILIGISTNNCLKNTG